MLTRYATAEARRALRLAHSGLGFGVGALWYALTGHTPPSAHQAMINLFCATGGRFNDVASRALGLTQRKVPLPDARGVLGDLSPAALSAHVARLREDGYLVFPHALPEDAWARLMDFARRTDATLRRMDGEADGASRRARFDGRPEAVRYDYPTQALLGDPDVQALLADHSLLALAQAYLGCCPRADVLSMWWHTAYKDQPDSEAAQFFHFDMDRLKWLKVFVYLTDVGPENGPHTFIAGSHRTQGIPSTMLQKGYARLSDEEVLAHYGRAAQVEFAAPRGTIIVEDTRGLHKGKVVTSGARLILQLQFSNSLFGAAHAPARLDAVHAPALRQLLEQAPAIYEAYR